MKKNILKQITLGFLVLLAMGCTKSFEEVNIDPDNSENPPLTNILAYTLRYTSDQLFDSWNDMNEPSTYGGYLAKIQYIDEARYEYRLGTVNNKWHYVYINYSNVKDIERRADEEKLVNMSSVAKVWGTVLMSIATDTWRDVPYSEAARMKDGILLPVYDTQETIYPKMLETLSIAAEAFASGATDVLGSGDVLYGGDVKKWQRFCNSLRLRLAIRISAVDPALAQRTIEQIMGDTERYPVIKENEDNAFFMWPGALPYMEPWADDKRSRDDYAVSNVLVNLLEKLADPRLAAYAHPVKRKGADGKYVSVPGVYLGFTIGPKDPPADIQLLSRIGARFRDEAAGFTPYFRAAETYLVLAEAAKLGWEIGGMSAQDAYEKGVTLSLEENGMSDQEAATYLENGANFDGTMEQIHEQMWIALFKQGMEGWSLYRRTGVPATNYMAPGNPYPGHNSPPFRYPYPVDEAALNGENNSKFAKEVVDFFWGKQMMWDKRTGVN